jgi:tetratricopeptide (TPR) repeat protein
MKKYLAIFMLLVTANAPAQARFYSKSDSAKAKAYFDSSWNFRLGSIKHQLYLDSALAIIPTHAWYWQQKAMPLYKAQKYELGKPFLDSAVKYDAIHWLDYRGFMECIFSRRYSESISDFRTAIAMFGNGYVMDHPYKFYIALSYLQLNNLDSSEYYLNSCMNDEQTAHGEDFVHYNHWFYKGILCYEKEQYANAIENFDRALKAYKQFSDAKYYKAICLVRMKKSGEALAVMEEAYTNFQEGFSMPEDNALYERYPYQVMKYYISDALENLRKKAAH